MGKKARLIGGALLAIVVIVLAVAYFRQHPVAVLDPKGVIADKEFRLMVTAAILSAVVIIPVFVLTFTVAWKYRASNKRAKHAPDWDHNTALELTWWGIPCAIILVLAVLAWTSSHQLDPYRKLSATTKPLAVQVVALQWKWLFIYPAQHVATVNFLPIPVGTPIDFSITSDAPMNSFWIPQLGGQVYAMSGMQTQLHLMADRPGTYYGASANISGAGFASMNFTADAMTQTDFARWVSYARQAKQHLTQDSYAQLAKPSQNTPLGAYVADDDNLYGTILMKYMPAMDMGEMSH